MRMRFFDKSGLMIDDNREAEFESSLHGREERSTTDDGTLQEQAEQIISTARQQLEALGFECSLSYSEPLTPIEKFKKASDKRWNPRRSASDAGDKSKMSPVQRFVAASNARWNIG